MMFNFSIPPDERRDMLYRLLAAWFIALAVTVALTADGRFPIIDQAKYSFAIATLMWFLIDIGDFFIFSNSGKRYPFSKKRYTYAAVAAVVANFCGFYIGDRLTNLSILTTNPSQAWTWAILELVIALLVIWFYAQRDHHKQDRRSSKEIRLRLLESQLEPHMLFNTLANLRALVKTDPDLATKMLDSIVDYLRATLGGSRAAMHPLSEEFARLNDYLKIMKVRMGKRLSYSLDLSVELADYPIPPFLLQPLVENAIKHGLEPKVEGGCILVKASITNDKVSLEVSDTGVGVNDEDLLASKGFGWSQVKERLLSTYGESATINLIATEAYKTSAMITFPFKKMSIIQ